MAGKKLNSRWRRGGNRYDSKTQDLIARKYPRFYKDGTGRVWYQGATIVPRFKI